MVFRVVSSPPSLALSRSLSLSLSLSLSSLSLSLSLSLPLPPLSPPPLPLSLPPPPSLFLSPPPPPSLSSSRSLPPTLSLSLQYSGGVEEPRRLSAGGVHIETEEVIPIHDISYGSTDQHRPSAAEASSPRKPFAIMDRGRSLDSPKGPRRCALAGQAASGRPARCPGALSWFPFKNMLIPPGHGSLATVTYTPGGGGGDRGSEAEKGLCA